MSDEWTDAIAAFRRIGLREVIELKREAAKLGGVGSELSADERAFAATDTPDQAGADEALARSFLEAHGMDYDEEVGRIVDGFRDRLLDAAAMNVPPPSLVH